VIKARAILLRTVSVGPGHMRHPLGAWCVLPVLAICLTASATAQGPGGDDADTYVGRVVIVPFSNISGDPDDDWIGSGIVETLMADFERVDGFDLIDRQSVAEAMRAVGGGTDAPTGDAVLLQVGRRVGARWLISGGYQRLGDQVRITARMVDVATGGVVRSAKVDGASADLFRLQDQIVGQLSFAGSVPVAIPATAPGSPEPETSATSSSLEVPSVVNMEGAALLAMIDGPPPPIAPEVMNRDEAGRTTVRAIKLDHGIRLDGELDEEVYLSVLPITDFLQQVPIEGAPATEKTEVWIMFDSTNVFVSARVWDSAPESEWVANEMRRDTNQLRQNDNFAVFFDTFYDRRNGVNFYTNPLGARADQQFPNEGNPNSDWNPIWDVRTGRFEGGWTVEMEIPFKSLRYRSGSPQLWGVQMRRSIRRKNEWAYLTRLPISAGGGSRGMFRVSAAGTLVGIEPPESGRNLEIKPYGIGGLTTDVPSGVENEGDADWGLDVKYGITPNLTADLTYNTDFAQVEVDEQQVNLTRFSLFFPEKREFFLEGRGIFGFAQGGIGIGGGGGGTDPTLFYSRRIGLEGGVVVPIYGGGRVTGKAGPFDVGALSIQTEDSLDAGTDSTNFTVLRVKRDIFRRSSVGGIFTNRSLSLQGDGASQAYGVDATFAFYENVSLLTYYAKTQTPGITDKDSSFQGRFEYGGDRYGLTADHLAVEDNFIPEVGFVRRDNFRRTNLSGRFSPRPRSIESVRQFTFQGNLDYYLTADEGLLETREQRLDFTTEFENSDQIRVNVTSAYELLEDPFEISDSVILPAGGYSFTNAQVSYTLGGQRRTSGRVSFTGGQFWNGRIKTVAYSQGRINVLDRFSIEPNMSLNWVDLPQGAFSTTVVSGRLNYAFNPRMFLGGLVQYSSRNDVVGVNLRFRWEYSPGSELFVVYTEERHTETLMPARYTELRNRGLVVKFNRLFRF
jgi:TolB-like protein